MQFYVPFCASSLVIMSSQDKTVGVMFLNQVGLTADRTQPMSFLVWLIATDCHSETIGEVSGSRAALVLRLDYFHL